MDTKNLLANAAGNARPHGRRPTRDQQRERHELLLSIALDTFLEKGFEQATIDEMVNMIGMSKRTVYALYKDKLALFEAAIQRAVDDYTLSYAQVEKLVEDDLAVTLRNIAMLRIRNATTLTALRLQRILTAQGDKLPHLVRTAITNGTQPTLSLLTDLIKQYAPPGSDAAEQPTRAAVAFMSLVAGPPVRLGLMGQLLDDDEIKAGVEFNVRLFLRGIGLPASSAPKRENVVDQIVSA